MAEIIIITRIIPAGNSNLPSPEHLELTQSVLLQHQLISSYFSLAIKQNFFVPLHSRKTMLQLLIVSRFRAP